MGETVHESVKLDRSSYEIKAQIIRAGFTMQEVCDRLHDDYGWSDSVSNFSNKLARNSLGYRETVEFAAALGYDIVWRKRHKGIPMKNVRRIRTICESTEHFSVIRLLLLQQALFIALHLPGFGGSGQSASARAGQGPAAAA